MSDFLEFQTNQRVVACAEVNIDFWMLASPSMRTIDQIEPFRVMQLLERVKELESQGQKIIHMEIAEPDFHTPRTVREAAKKATGYKPVYTPSTSAPALQKALSAWSKNEYNVRVSPGRIMITPGTSGAFSVLYAVLINAG